MRAFAVRDFGQVPALIQRMGASVLLSSNLLKNHYIESLASRHTSLRCRGRAQGFQVNARGPQVGRRPAGPGPSTSSMDG